MIILIAFTQELAAELPFEGKGNVRDRCLEDCSVQDGPRRGQVHERGQLPWRVSYPFHYLSNYFHTIHQDNRSFTFGAYIFFFTDTQGGRGGHFFLQFGLLPRQSGEPAKATLLWK